MSENICFYCSTPINHSYNFCVNCEKQTKCVNCGELLVPQKSKCLKCGRSIIDYADGSRMNEFTLEESQTRTSSKRTVKGILSDNAIAQVAAVLTRSSAPIKLTSPKSAATVGQAQLPFPSDDQSDTTLDSEGNPPTGQNSDEETDQDQRVKSYFTEDGKGSLVARTIDFKGKNKKEQQIRFMLLFVAAYNNYFKKPVPQQKIIFDALDKSNMLDINAKAKHFKFVETNYLMQIGDAYSINLDGEREIEKIIVQMQGEKSGFTDWEKPSRQRGKQNRVGEEVMKQVKEWVNMDSKIGEFDTRTLKTPTKYAMFGVFLLTKSLSVVTAAPYAVVHEYLSKKYTIPISKDAMRKAFIRPTNASRFEKTSDGGFYLTPQAEREVKDWLSGKSITEDKE